MGFEIWTAQLPRLLRAGLCVISLFHLVGVVPATVAQNKTLPALEAKLADGEKLFNEGEDLFRKGTPESYQLALKKYLLASDQWRGAGDLKREAQALSRVASTYFQLDEYPKALEAFIRSLNLNIDLGDRAQQAYALNGIGRVYWATGEYGKALDFYNRSLALRRADGNRAAEAYTLGNIGAVHWARGEGTQALERYTEALPIMESLGNKDGQAFVLYNIGLLHAARGESAEALQYYDRALRFERDTGDSRSQATTLNNIGLVYSILGEYTKALDYFSQALSIRRVGNHRPGIALTLRNIGDVYAKLGKTEDALRNYLEATPLSQAVGDRRGLGYILESIGALYRTMREFEKARSYFEQANELFRGIEHKRGEAETLANIGSTYFALGQGNQAMQFYGKAVSIFHDVEDRLGESQTLYEIARVQRALGNLERARIEIERAQEIAEFLRANVDVEDLRTSYFATVQDYYDFEIDLLMELHQRAPAKQLNADALQVSEKARARSLIDLLAQARIDIHEGVDEELAQQETTLRQQLREKQNYRTRLLSGKTNDEELASVQTEIGQLRRAYEDVLSGLKAASPGYFALIHPQTLDLKQIQTQLLDEKTVLLEYSLGDDRSFVWAVTSSSIHSFELPKRSEIENAARKLNESLRARNLRPTGESPELRAERLASADAEYLRSAQFLSRTLIGPVANELGEKRLLIVAEGALQYVPFAALAVPKPDASELEPLVVKHEIVTLPSASTISVLRREVRKRPKSTRSLFVFGDPVFELTDSRLRNFSARCGNESAGRGPMLTSDFNFKYSDKENKNVSSQELLSRLLFSCDEALSILSLVAPDQRKQALNFEANRALALSNELRDYRVIHFATHAKIDPVHPDASGIVLSRVSENGRWKGDSLTLSDIYNMRLSAQLVVLSGCETALGKEVRGEGVIGLTRGFMYAGSLRVVSTLWRIDDRVTSELMKSFYIGIFKKNLSPAAALKEAQVAIWRKRSWSHPYYWAAFTLHGEPNKMN